MSQTLILILTTHAGAIGFQRIQPSLVGVESGTDGHISIFVTREGPTNNTASAVYTVVGGQDDFTSSAGFVFLDRGESATVIDLAIVDDDVPELDENFSVVLTQVTGAQLDPGRSSVVVTISANDDPHGVIEFESDAMSIVAAEPSTLHLTLVRSRGLFGSVSVTFNVNFDSNGASATDVAPDSGIVTFAEGQRTAVLTLDIVPDGLPELAEIFDIELLSNITGGATLGANTTASLVISANGGSVQFVNQEFSVREDAGTLSVRVARSGIVDGVVEVAYRLVAITAQSGVDYLGEGGTVTFAPFQLEQTLTLQVFHDGQAAPRKLLNITLVNVTGNSIVSENNTVTVYITDVDGGSGRFGWTPSSLSVVANKPASGSADVVLSITRSAAQPAALYGSVVVAWSLQNAPTGRFNVTSGTVPFTEGQSSGSVALKLMGDTQPELDRQYTVVLSLVSGDALLVTASSIATIAVNGSNNPFGSVQFGPAAPTTTSTQNGLLVDRVVSFTLLRLQSFYGDVMVTCAASFVAAGGGVQSGVVPATSNFVIAENQTSLNTNITLSSLADIRKGGVFVLTLTAVRVVGVLAATSAASSTPPTLGSRSNVTVTPSIDLLSGTIAMQTISVPAVAEGGAINVTAVRSDGTYGAVNVTWAFAASSVADASDVQQPLPVFAFAHGRTTASISIRVLADGVPELDEALVGVLSAVTAGFAVINSTRLQFNTTILLSDEPFG